MNTLQWDSSQLHFDFPISNREARFKELYLYIAHACREDSMFSSVKLNKILFFSDFDAYAKFQKPITGMSYQKLPQGPAPKALVALREEMLQDAVVRFERRAVHDWHRERAIPLREPNRLLFSAEEIAIVDKWVRFFWNKTATYVSNYSHGKAWKIVRQGELIPYEAAFISDAPVTPEDIAKVKALAERYGWAL